MVSFSFLFFEKGHVLVLTHTYKKKQKQKSPVVELNKIPAVKMLLQ